VDDFTEHGTFYDELERIKQGKYEVISINAGHKQHMTQTCVVPLQLVLFPLIG